MSDKRGGSKDGRRFSAREIRAVLLMLPLIAALVWIVYETVRPGFDDSAAVLGDAVADTIDANADRVGTDARGGMNEEGLFRFDPNTVTYEELRRFCVPKNTAAGIIRYRKAGKIFRIPEDFAACYGVSDSMYAAMKPFIVIGAEYAVSAGRGAAYDAGGRRSSGALYGNGASKPFDPNALSADGFEKLGFSEKQARAIVAFRGRIGGFRTAEDFAKSYVVSPEMFARLKDRIVIGGAVQEAENPLAGGRAVSFADGAGGGAGAVVDINHADSVQLVAVRGIGAKTVSAIIAYRKRLGGYHDIGQICETGVVTERNWESIREQICADSCAIQKIDINFATPNSVAKHPYISPRTLRKLLRNRQLRGGWSKIEDMIEDNTLTSQEARKLAPYLQFRAVSR